MNDILVSIGKNIKCLRSQLGYSQEMLSIMSGVERAQLSRIESGEVNGVTFLTIEKILNSLGKTISYSNCDDSKIDVHPFVKWAGGKTQLLEIIKDNMPKQYNRYFEPFVGGGALLFEIQPNDFVINDNNSELMCAYKCFLSADQFKSMINDLEYYEASHSEDYYYQVREMDKQEDFHKMKCSVQAARMIYLNKACFNGLYRVNSKGFFNVPSGKKDKVNCFDRKNFENLFKFFNTRKVSILNTDFETAVADAKEGDFVYFDPPYDVLEGKNTFTSYSKDSFGKKEQERLRDLFVSLSKKGVYVMLSNHNTAYIRELYKDFNINIVSAKRMINSKGTGRGDVEEVLITNYVNSGDNVDE